MTPEQTAVARRLVGAGFARAGMWTTDGSVLLSDPVYGSEGWAAEFVRPGVKGTAWADFDDDETIDLMHPATIGCIEHLAREAWGDDGLHVAPEGGQWFIHSGDGVWQRISADSRGEAWAAALLDAPAKEAEPPTCRCGERDCVVCGGGVR